MAVNDIAVQEFVNAIKEPPQDTNNTYNATVSRIDDEGVVWVYLQGSEIETPTASTSSEVEAGDSVTVQWRNNKLYIEGNYSNPSAGTATVMPSVNFVSELLDKNISADSVSAATGYIGELTAEHITADDIQAGTGYIKELRADNITAEDISASSGYIKDLTTGNVTAQNVIADHATVGSLNTNYAHITNGVIDNAKIGYADVDGLNANYAHISNGTIDNAKIDQADVNNLNANYAQINLANVNNAWIENGLIKDAAISDAQILGVSANKLTAGTIDASNITVTNLNASNITTGSITVDGITIDVENNEASIDGEYIEDGTITLNGLAQEVTDKIDGAIETFTGSAVPTLNNYPASSWTTTKIKDSHIGDVYYVLNTENTADGYCYRFAKDGNTYKWILIKDSDVTAALSRLTTAEGKISGLESFESTTSSWITNTDEELGSIKSNHTSLVTVVDKTVKETVQLWFTKANTTAPSKPTAQVTNNSPTGSNSYNKWNLAVPQYNSSYPNYYYCYQWKYVDGTYGWSAVTRDIAMGESQSTARTAASDASTAVSTAETASTNASNAVSTANTASTNASTALSTASTANTNASTALSTANTAASDASSAVSTANTANSNASSAVTTANAAQTTANANIKSSVQLWFTKANTTAPSKPTAHVTTNDASKANQWNIAVPTYNGTYPNYFYCYEYQKGDGTYAWSNVVYDRATTENQSNSRSALSQVATKVETSTFNTLSQTVDSNTANITSLSNVVETKADSSTVTTLSNTVNEVSQTATGNSSKISSLTNTLGTNADGTTKAGDIVHRTSAVEQDLSGFKTTVSKTYHKTSDFNTYKAANDTAVAAAKKAGDDAQADLDEYKGTVSETYATKSSLTQTAEGISTRVGKTEMKLAGMYATSSTAAGTAAKVATIVPTLSGYELANGATVTVKFTKANTAASPTLNLNGTGAKAIKTYSGGNLTADEYKWKAGSTFTFTYNGTNWLMQDSTVATRMTSAESSISQNASNIELKVSKDGVISSINQSAETVKIQASKVEIDGTAIFNAISDDVDDAITDKGYATTTQAQGYANDAKNEAIAEIPTDVSELNNDSGYQTASDVSGAIVSTTTLYYASNSTTAPNKPTAHVTTDSASKRNAWNIALPAYNASYPHLYVCTETKTKGGAYAWTSVEQTTYASAISAIKTTADGAAPKSSAIAEEQRIYYRSNSSTKPNGNGLPTTWVTETGDKYNTNATTSTGWSKKVTPIANGTGSSVTKYLYLWTCIQKKTVDGTVTYGDILLDGSTTVIDGGKIVTGSVSANAVSASSGTFDTANIPNLNASKITAGDISADRMKVNSISAINSNTGTVKISASKVEIDGTATFNAIKAKADAAYDAKGAASAVQTNLNNLQIGGRNLHKNANTLDDGWRKGGTTVSDGVATIPLAGPGEHRIYQMPANGYWGIWEANTTYTVSVDAKTDTTGLRLSLEPYANGVSSKAFDLTTEWKRYSYTFTSGDATATASCSYFAKNGTSGNVFIRHPKLEKGNKATDWTPAPEDVQAEIDAKKSVHTLMSSGNGSTYANILTWTAEGRSNQSWGIDTTATPITDIKVGDTVRVAYKVTDMGTSDNRPYVYVIGEFERSSGSTVYLTMHGLDTTIIDGGNILTNSIGANQIASNAITADKIAANAITIGNMDSNTANKVNNGDSALTKVNYYNRACQVGNSSNTQTHYWRKFASYTETRGYRDAYIIFDVSNNGDYGSNKKFGRLKANFRTDWPAGTIRYPKLEWIIRGEGISLSDFVLAYKATSGTDVKVELWAYCPTAWGGYRFGMVEEGERASIQTTPLWTLHDSWTADGSESITSGYTQVTSTDIDAARTTATTYITHIDNNGIRVHPSSTENNSAVINADGLEIFKGGTTSEYSVAKYGDTARIGKESGSHLTLSPDSMSMSTGTKDVFNLLQKTMYIYWTRNYKGRQFANSTDRHVDAWETNTTISTWDSITVNYKLNNTSKTKKITSISNGVLANDEIYVHFNYSGTKITLTYGRGSSAASSDIIKLESAVVYYVTDEKLSQLHTGTYPNTTVSGALRIGNGTSDSNRINLMLVDWSGTGKFKGDILAFCGADSSGGMSLTKAEENIDAFKYEDANGHVYIDAYRVGRIVSLLCTLSKTASIAPGADLYRLDLTNAHLPKPLGTNTSGTGISSKNMIIGNIYYNKTVTPNRYEFVCRNGGSTAMSTVSVGFTITYICQMDEVSGEIKYMDD